MIIAIVHALLIKEHLHVRKCINFVLLFSIIR